MPFLLAAGVGLALGFALRGRISNLTSLQLSAWPLLLLAVLLRLLAELLDLPLALPLGVLMLLVFAVLNWRRAGLPLLAAGAALNLVVVLANAGHMPITLDLVKEIGGAGAARLLQAHASVGDYSPVTPQTRLWWLADVLLLPGPVPRALSAGDVLIMAGLVLAIALGMRPRRTLMA